jgi:Flp pilus assembly protein TadD
LVARYRRAVALEPENHEHLSDLGYALTEAGCDEEAEEVLTRAVRLAPPDYRMARGNLDYLQEVRAGKKPD